MSGLLTVVALLGMLGTGQLLLRGLGAPEAERACAARLGLAWLLGCGVSSLASLGILPISPVMLRAPVNKLVFFEQSAKLRGP